MRTLLAALTFAVALGCGPQSPAPSSPPAQQPPPAAPRGNIQCGAATCGPDEYCENRCLCCGAYIADPAQARSETTCKPLPASCHGANGPECQQRTVDVPCA